MIEGVVEVEVTAAPSMNEEAVKVVEVPVEVVVEREVIREVEVPVEVVVEREVIREVEVPAKGVEAKEPDKLPEVPAGHELARHTHGDETYTLVEYGRKIAVFSQSDSPVTSPRLAGEVLRSYAWGQALEDFDSYRVREALDAIQDFDFRVSELRDTSADAVNMLDQLETLSAEVPLLGRVSAMDVVSFTYSEAEDAANTIRSLHAELVLLNRNSEELEEAVDSMSRADPSEVSGGEMEHLFTRAMEASRDMGSRVSRAEIMVGDARDFAWAMENAMRQASDTPVIGDALAESAETAGEYESIFAGLGDATGSAHDELKFLAAEFQSYLDAADGAHQSFMDRWLQDPTGGE